MDRYSVLQSMLVKMNLFIVFILIAFNLPAGFRWLLSEISKDHVNLSRRIEKDVAEQVNIKTNWC